MGALDGRVVIVTGSGRGLGREHALAFAAEGASVVVNDLGGDAVGEGSDLTPAQATVKDIEAMGGRAVADGEDVSDAAGAERLIRHAIDEFGDLHTLVNNAGILRDRVIINMTDEEWDSVIRVHMRGHFMPTRAAAIYWRQQAKDGKDVNASVVHTTSTSGLNANSGQANYGAAKSAIATLSQICSKEFGRYGVRSNAIAPAARTRMTTSTPGLAEHLAEPEDPSVFDVWNAANVSPFIVYLALPECTFTGETFFVQGGRVQRFQPWTLSEVIEKDSKWTLDELRAQAPQLVSGTPASEVASGQRATRATT
ncbi:MAG: SDR family oxidoreductase [Acidimicrobiia bacterium]